MILRAILLFFVFAFPIYLALKFLAEARLTRAGATKAVKTTGLILISATLSGIALILIMIADKLL